jgi:cytochrome oxidase Cu insertion factor (SCO1/SenC/PrrC family)
MISSPLFATKKRAARAFTAIAALLISYAVTAGNDQDYPGWLSSPLISSTGNVFSIGDLAGKLVLVNFMFTSCADICPLQTSALRQVMSTLDQAELSNLVFLSISIDPTRDLPEELARYKRNYKIDTDTWIFSTGSETSINALTSAFDTLSDNDAMLNHRARYYLLDRRGRLLLSYNSKVTDVNRISRDLKNAVATL